MSIPARVKRTGTWWQSNEITTSQELDGDRRKIRLTIGGDLRIDLSRARAVDLINQIADILEH